MPPRTKPLYPAASANGTGKEHDYAKVFEVFDMALGEPNSSHEAIAEACPWCGGEKFHLNIRTGLYHCKHCDESGNVTTFLTRIHGAYLEQTTADQYSRLGNKRGIKPQTLRRHELAYRPSDNCWLIPFKNAEGSVVNILRYWPDREADNKRNLPELPSCIYGYDQLIDPKKKNNPVLICEGPFDAIALDYSIGAENRGKYVIIATPGAFKKDWAPLFKGRKVSAFYDQDKGGEQHRDQVRNLLGKSGVAAELRLLEWPAEIPEDCKDVNDLIRLPDFKGKSALGWLQDHSPKMVAEPKLLIYHGKRPEGQDTPPDWIWQDRIPCKSYVSFSGQGGTFKTSIACEIAARYSTGKPMPLCEKATMPAGHVLYIFIEDDRSKVEDSFERAGGNFDHWHPMPAKTVDGEIVNVLDHLKEIKDTVREFGIRLVILDGQNSLVGAPNISTDMQARNNVSNKLHTFAQEMNLCLLGIRNEDNDGRAMGPQSFGDIGRAIIRAVEDEPKSDPPFCKLVFKKVNDSARKNHPDLPYSVEDLGGSKLKILWGKVPPSAEAAAGLKQRLEGRSKSNPKTLSQNPI